MSYATDTEEINIPIEQENTIPTNNAQVFQLREIINQHKEKKRALNRNHSLGKLISRNQNTYLTEPNIRAKSRRDNRSSVFPTLDDKEERALEDEMGKINKVLQKKIDSIGYKQEESIKDFINKTRE